MSTEGIILIIIGILFLAGFIVYFGLSYSDIKHPYPPASTSSPADPAKEQEVAMAQEYLKAQREINSEFFKTGRDILNHTAQTAMRYGVRNQQPTNQADYHPNTTNSHSDFDDFEEI